MTFEVADIARGDVLAVYESLDAAKDAVRVMCDGHPEFAEDLAVLTIDAEGRRAGEPLPAEQFLSIPA